GDDGSAGSGVDAIDAAATVAEVQRIRDEAVSRIEAARADAGGPSVLDPALVATETRIRAAAAARIAQLTGQPVTGEAGTVPGGRPRLRTDLFGRKGEWDADSNPLSVPGLPAFANDWVNHRLGNLQKNIDSMGSTPMDTWLQAVMSSAPTALFLL